MLQSVLLGFIFFLLAPVCGAIISGADRFLGARMQRRQGPTIVQPFYDLYKFFQKKAYIVNGLQDFLVIGHLMFVMLSGWIIYAGQDILLAVFSLTLAEMFLCLAAFSASAPYSNMSAQRELLQMTCTEPMLLLMAIGFYLHAGSFLVSDMVLGKMPAIVSCPGMFAGFLIILVIELRKSPFDVSSSHHAHQEMVKGITTDISGKLMGWVELAEWNEIFLMFTFVGLFFVCSNPWSILWAILAGAGAMFLMTLIDNTFPRVKWERMLTIVWSSTFIFAGGNLLVLMLLKG
ncbi:ech hydrogenase subunit B [Lachnospiraceae bacterium NK3A20]|nr:ech hydrogenase subunit B [Lachnospiraceae bacterium NK3A20]